jgi:hypothetical protein
VKTNGGRYALKSLKNRENLIIILGGIFTGVAPLASSVGLFLVQVLKFILFSF